MEKTAIVTGGGRGIGAAICKRLAGEGYSLVINYAGNDEAARETQAACEALGAKVILCKGNVADEEDCKRLVATAAQELGRVDLLVNNAGITRDGLMMRMSAESFDEVLSVNLKGAFYCVKAVSRIMIKQRGGSIVNISSVVGVTGNAGQANYAASKAGLIGLTKSAAKELAGKGITVNAVAPGYIGTDMTDKLGEEAKAEIVKTIPLGRAGEGSDVAAAVAFFAGDGARYITGQVLHVDGGMVI